MRAIGWDFPSPFSWSKRWSRKYHIACVFIETSNFKHGKNDSRDFMAAALPLFLTRLCCRVKGLRDDLPPTSTVCKTFPGLTKGQLELCHKYPDVTAAAFHGLQMAVEECQYQFRWHRWNCSSLNTKNRNPHSSSILQKGNAIRFRHSAGSPHISLLANRSSATLIGGRLEEINMLVSTADRQRVGFLICMPTSVSRTSEC
ncbi:Protein Wnt-10a [Homalodisca vitripennis]|nr:Protein Wnt-10a [Homalodisca vitripennis]